MGMCAKQINTVQKFIEYDIALTLAPKFKYAYNGEDKYLLKIVYYTEPAVNSDDFSVFCLSGRNIYYVPAGEAVVGN
jgi:hypothetical protein